MTSRDVSSNFKKQADGTKIVTALETLAIAAND